MKPASPLKAYRAPTVASLILKERKRGMRYFSDYPMLAWVRRNPTIYAAQGWREKAGCNCVERIK